MSSHLCPGVPPNTIREEYTQTTSKPSFEVVWVEMREPRPEGRGIIWKGLRTPPKADLKYPALKGQVFFFLDK